MKNLDLIEDEYKIAFDEVVDKYRVKLQSSKDKNASREEFARSFKKILEKRNREYLNYVKKNGNSLLEMPEKKVKVEKKMGVYKAYNLNFNPTFKERIVETWRRFSFKFSLRIRSLKYNIIPSFLKLFFFKVKLFLSSIFFDIGNLRRFVGRRIGAFTRRHFNAIRENVLAIINWFKSKWAIFEEWKKKKIEDRKAKQAEIEAKKLADIEAKKKAAESSEESALKPDEVSKIVESDLEKA